MYKALRQRTRRKGLVIGLSRLSGSIKALGANVFKGFQEAFLAFKGLQWPSNAF